MTGCGRYQGWAPAIRPKLQSLSVGRLRPAGALVPPVKISGSSSEWTVWTTPGDDSTAVTTRNSGNSFKISAPGFGVINHDAGITYPDGTHHGTTLVFPFTPEIEAALCAALTP